jgi:hypothetical protein
MERLKTVLVGAVLLLIGVVVGSWWPPAELQAQILKLRFETEVHGQVLFIRHLNDIRGVDCYLAVAGTAIVSVPCDRDDLARGRR